MCDIRLAPDQRIATMISMRRFQFSLRQLLIGVVIVAVVLVAVRFAIRSHGLAVGLVALLIGAALLAVLNVLTYSFLRAFGAVFSPEPSRGEEEVQAAGAAANEPARENPAS
jgi:hypothetical protein